MSDREKLIKLIEESYCPVMGGFGDEEKVRWLAGLDIYYNWEDVADHLIANNVVIQKQGEWLLEARSFYRDTFDESCELVVYILATCSECGAKHPNRHEVFSKTLYAPEDVDDFRFNREAEETKALVEFRNGNYVVARYCPNCGAKMDGDVNA